MEFLENLREGLAKTFSNLEKRIQGLKTHVSEEIHLLRLKSHLEKIRLEMNQTFTQIGEDVYRQISLRQGLSVDLFVSRVDYINGLARQMKDVEMEINNLYKIPSLSDREIIVEQNKQQKGE